MTSEQVKAILKQMADFNGAIVHAGEILAAVENGERQLADFDKLKDEKQRQIDALDKDVLAAQGRAQAAKKEFNAQMEQMREQKQMLLDSVSPTREELAQLKSEIETRRANFNDEIRALGQKLAEMKKRTADAEQEFQAVLKRHAG